MARGSESNNIVSPLLSLNDITCLLQPVAQRISFLWKARNNGTFTVMVIRRFQNAYKEQYLNSPQLSWKSLDTMKKAREICGL